MKKLAYLDCPTGISGDMCLGALVDAGVPLDYLERQLSQLGLSNDYTLSAGTVQRNGQQATHVVVALQQQHDDQLAQGHHHPTHSGRHLPEIEQRIQQAQLPPRVTHWSLAIFRQLARAEADVHGIPVDQVHFHEVGAADAIVDIVGTCLGFDWLGIETLYCSPLPTGGGLVRAAHGQLPVPAPAVLRLMVMGQVPIYSNGIQKELVTPTGAAIATTLVQQFGPAPTMTLTAVGLGAGSRDLPIPNILRLWIGHVALTEQDSFGQATRTPHSHAPESRPEPDQGVSDSISTPQTYSPIQGESETIIELQTQVDDLNPQAIGYLFDRLLTVGARDVFTQPIGMKKSRPGHLITVLCFAEQVLSCQTILFQETTTLGIRHTVQHRQILKRDFQTVDTPYGKVRLKLGRQPKTNTLLNVQPEYEDCAQLARQHQLPWREIHRLALHCWYKHHPQADQDQCPSTSQPL
ncbi:MAG: nickel pincer cofactor biosynthesis protein LarC [Cyanobacteria bacterium P01_A01_bin.123]